MDNETKNLSNTLKELAELKRSLGEKKKEAEILQEIISDKDAEDTWRKNIDYENLDYDPEEYWNLKRIDYELFENENLKRVKEKLSKQVQDSRELAKNEPKKKPITNYDFDLLDWLNILLSLAFIGSFIAALCTGNIGLYIVSPLFLIGAVLYTIFYKKAIAQMKEYKAIKKQNAENTEWNNTTSDS